MVSSIGSYNWYPSLFQNASQVQANTSRPYPIDGITSVDGYVSQNATEQTLNLPNLNAPTDLSTYDLLNNLSNTTTFYGITNLDTYAQTTLEQQTNPSLYQVNQATQSYSMNQSNTVNMYTLGNLYNQTI